MSLKKQFSHLRKSAELKPDKTWENKTKYELLAEISSQNRLMQAQKLSASERADMLIMGTLNKLAPSFSKVVAGFLIIIMGSGVSMAAQASVPGQPLWPVKRSIEKAELTLTFSPVKETEIHIKHASKRLEEIDKILEKADKEVKTVKTTEQKKAIKQAVTHLEKDIKSADNSLKVVKEEKKPIEVVELAKKVIDATKGVKENLKEQKAKAHDDSMEKVFNEAAKANEVVNDVAVSIALEVHEEVEAVIKKNVEKEAAQAENSTSTGVEINADVVVDEEEPDFDQSEADTIKAVVKELIAAEIVETQVELEDIKVKVEIVDQADTDKTDSGLNGDLVEGIKNTPNEAEFVLTEAKVLLEEGSLKGALEKVSQSKEITEKTEVALEQIKENEKLNDSQTEAEVIEGTDKPLETDVENTTSSLEVIENEEVDNTVGIEESGSDVEMTTDDEIKEEDTNMIDPKDLIYDHQLY